jgi:hypothetical protein
MAKEKHRRLLYLSRSMDELSLLARSADVWMNPAECDALADELDPLVRSMAAKVNARVPELVLPRTPDDGNDGIDEVVEKTLQGLRENLAACEQYQCT